MSVAVVAEGYSQDFAGRDFQRLPDHGAEYRHGHEILDIVKYKDGSRVSLYQGPPWAKSGSLRKSVRDCL